MKSPSYRAKPFFILTGILPIFASTIGIAIYIRSNKFEQLPYLAEVMTSNIGCRFYSVIFNIIGWFTIPIYFLVEKILTFKSKNQQRNFIDYIRTLIAIVSFFIVIVFSTTIIARNKKFYEMSGIAYSILFTIYFVLVDLKMTMIKININKIDLLWDLMLMLNTSSILFYRKFLFGYDDVSINSYKLMEYFMVPFLFLKFIMLYKRLPSFSIIIENKNK